LILLFTHDFLYTTDSTHIMLTLIF
jgi:hypothetical protein